MVEIYIRVEIRVQTVEIIKLEMEIGNHLVFVEWCKFRENFRKSAYFSN